MLARRALPVVGSMLLLSLLSGAAAAQSAEGRLEHFTDPASTIARGINDLYYLILPISIVIGILVEAILLYFIFRYRAQRGPIQATDEHERGHTKLEIGWTIPPAVILLMVGVLSANTLTAIENPPPVDFTVDVVGRQWSWEFVYPDGSVSPGELAVEAGKVVKLNVSSVDVIHSFAVPALGVKIDAIPGRLNTYWFRAEAPGQFLAQCMEYCAGAHSKMVGTVTALPPGSTPSGWRAAAAAQTCAVVAPNATAAETRFVEGGGNPWSVQPDPLQVNAGQVCFRVVNPAGQRANHNLGIETMTGQKVLEQDPVREVARPGGEIAAVATLQAGAYRYYCNIPGHRELGMVGQLTVT